MAYKIDLTGRKYGRLIVLKYAGMDVKHHQFWLCKCECGNEKIVRAGHLNSGYVKSCGCIAKENLRKISQQNSDYRTLEKLYDVWTTMIQRTENPNANGYQNYGGKGIGVCAEWRYSYLLFKEWSESSGYKDGLTIDRINGDKNYSPDNCRWVDRYVQNNNTARNVFCEYEGKCQTIAQWAREYNVNYRKLQRRIKRGIPVHIALQELTG